MLYWQVAQLFDVPVFFILFITLLPYGSQLCQLVFFFFFLLVFARSPSSAHWTRNPRWSSSRKTFIKFIFDIWLIHADNF